MYILDFFSASVGLALNETEVCELGLLGEDIWETQMVSVAETRPIHLT